MSKVPQHVVEDIQDLKPDRVIHRPNKSEALLFYHENIVELVILHHGRSF